MYLADKVEWMSKKNKKTQKKPRKKVSSKILDHTMIKQVSMYLDRGYTVQDVCNLMGFTRPTFWSWSEKGKRLSLAIETGKRKTIKEEEELFISFYQETTKARANSRMRAIDAVRGSFMEDWKAAKWYLEKTDPEHWGGLIRDEEGKYKSKSPNSESFDLTNPLDYLANLPRLIISGQISEKQLDLLIKVVNTQIAANRLGIIDEPIDSDPRKALKAIRDEIDEIEKDLGLEIISGAGEIKGNSFETDLSKGEEDE